MSEDIIEVNDSGFDEHVLRSSLPVLVDFWAEWCAPCKMVLPLLGDVAREYAGRIKFVKIDVDKNQEIPTKYGVRGIPTLIIFKDGQVEQTSVGAVTRSQLELFISRSL